MLLSNNTSSDGKSIIKRLSFLDRFLPIWILLAIAIGLLLGLIPNIKDVFNVVQIRGTVSLPIAIGLFWMMYPVLAKVKYEDTPKAFKEWKLFTVSLTLNWIIGPFLMFFLALTFLYENQFADFREGMIIIGLARCIAMVLIWNMLAGGDNEHAAILVAINSIFQILTYSILSYFFLTIMSGWFNLPPATAEVKMSEIAISVAIYLGIPLVAGMITRLIGVKAKGKEWYDQKFAPKLGPVALFGLLYTVIIMFAMQGKEIIGLKWQLFRIASPLFLYFIIMFLISYVGSWLLRFNYKKTVTQSFTAASNNFELAIAVAIGTWGITSKQALATVIGPLIEVPVLIGLVYVSIWLKKFFYTIDGTPKKVFPRKSISTDSNFKPKESINSEEKADQNDSSQLK